MWPARAKWSPGRPTVVFVGNVPFGLTVYESTEHVDATYEWDSAIRYVRASQAPAKRRPARGGPAPTYKRHMPSGHLGVRAYSPHGRVSWERRWTEATAGALMRKVTNIESFFEDAERRASTLPAEELTATRERLSRSRDVLGGTNTLDRFHEWTSPDERG